MFITNNIFGLYLIMCLTATNLSAMKKGEQSVTKPKEDKKDFHAEILEKFNGNTEELNKFIEGIREKEIFKLKRDLPKIEAKKYENPKLFHADSIAKVANINNLINEELSKIGKFYNSQDEKGQKYFLSRAGIASPSLLQEENKDFQSSFEQAKLKTWLSLESKDLEKKLSKKSKVRRNPNSKSCPEITEENKSKMKTGRKSLDIPAGKHKEVIEIPPEVPDLIKLSNSTDQTIEETPDQKLKNLKNSFKKYITAKKVKHSEREISNENFSLLSIDDEPDKGKSKTRKNKNIENKDYDNRKTDNNSKDFDPNWWSQHYSLNSSGQVVLTEPYCINYGVQCKPIPVTSVPKDTDKILPVPIIGKITNDKNVFQNSSTPETSAANDQTHPPENAIIRKYTTANDTNRVRNVITPVLVRDRKSKRAVKLHPSRERNLNEGRNIKGKEEKKKSNSKSDSNNSQKRKTDSNNFKVKANKRKDKTNAASNVSKLVNDAELLANSKPLVNIVDKTENSEKPENKRPVERKARVKKEKLAKNIDEIDSDGKIKKSASNGKKDNNERDENDKKSRCNIS